MAAWNAHDLERVLQHFSEDVIFTSPHARQLLDGCDGVVRGKEGLRRYWQEGLRQIADLRFELLGVYVGTNTIVINYRNQRGGLASEVLVFEGLSFIEGHGTYLEGAPYHGSGAAEQST